MIDLWLNLLLIAVGQGIPISLFLWEFLNDILTDIQLLILDLNSLPKNGSFLIRSFDWIARNIDIGSAKQLVLHDAEVSWFLGASRSHCCWRGSCLFAFFLLAAATAGAAAGGAFLLP
jgi:hypothetical protein